jgi:site-specific recombinase XerD
MAPANWRTKSSKNRDTQIVAHFLPLLGAKRLDTITKSDVVRYMNIRRTQLTASPRHKQRRRVSESTVRRERGLLQAIFERAIEEGHEIRNPFRGIKRGKDKARTRVLTLDEEPWPSRSIAAVCRRRAFARATRSDAVPSSYDASPIARRRLG